MLLIFTLKLYISQSFVAQSGVAMTRNTTMHEMVVYNFFNDFLISMLKYKHMKDT